MENHGYTIHSYDGKNIVGNRCRIFELRDNGEQVYTLRQEYDEDGTLDPVGEKHFLKRADAYIEKRRAE